MTIEERNTKLKHFITCLKCEASGKKCDDNCSVQYEAGNMGEIIENLEAISKALEQEPCDDEYIKVPKKALKYRTAGMVAYNAEWLKNHFDIERAVICGAQKSCEDAISRQAVIDGINQYFHDEYYQRTSIQDCRDCLIEDVIKDISPINPQLKTGHWIGIDEEPHEDYECDRCGYVCSTFTANIKPSEEYKYCPNCGIKMIEPQESEG